MKGWIKILLAVIGGFGGGFAAGFFVCKKANDLQFEEVSEEDLNKLLESAAPQLPAAEKKEPITVQQEMEKIFEKVENAGTDPEKMRIALQKKTPYVAADDEKKQEYSKMWNAVKEYSNEENANDIPTQDDEEEEDADEEFMNVIAEEIHDDILEPEVKKEPYLISLGAFYEERREYDKITIDWYDEDDIALNEREEIIPDLSTYLGYGVSMKDLFGQAPMDGDPDSRFIRNDEYHSDYEIIRHHGSWFEVTGGKAD